MSLNNFIPTIWSANLLKERDRVAIAVKNCNRTWEGAIRDKGDKVKILTIGDVTIGDYTKNSTAITPQELDDASTFLEITQSKYFAFKVDDVDKAQSIIGGAMMREGMRKAAVGLANAADDFIYGKYGEAGTTITKTGIVKTTILSIFSAAEKALLENNVPRGAEKFLEISPAIYEKLVLARLVRETANTDVLDNGQVADIFGFKVFVSNGIVSGGTNQYYCIARTRDAIAYAEQLNKVEAYRPEGGFSDAVKGLHLYGAKVVRPKELVCLNITTTDESDI